MNLNTLAESLPYINAAGVNLNVEQISIIRNSLLILKYENHFNSMYFWGKICGIEGDYYVAYGYTEDAMYDKKYFYSTNQIQWLLLQKPKQKWLAIEPVLFFFHCDPTLKVNTSNLLDKFEGIEDLKEEDWLSIIVCLIAREAEILPRGYLYLNSDGSVVRNKHFQGLDLRDSLSFTSFFHYRKPLQKWNTNMLTKNEFNYTVDFLDSIDTDIPNGCWICDYDNDKKNVFLKNLYWPGMIFYLKINSTDFGFLYIGNGMKNLDVPFML